MRNDINALRRTLAQARNVCVLTGAGASAESGIPTFRDDAGIWKNHNPLDLATPDAFARDPETVWAFYRWRRERVLAAAPGTAHAALAAMERRIPQFTLITQNVDGLHDLAGSQNIIALHGDLFVSRCVHCGHEEKSRDPDIDPLPRCPDCGGLLRPGVVWFGEPLRPEIWESAVRAAFNCQVFLSVGTSAAVQPAASLILAAREGGAVTAEINLERAVDDALLDFAITGKAGEILPRLVPGHDD